MKAHAASMGREEEFEVEGMPGVRVLAVGLMTGGKNRMLSETTDAEGKTNVAKLVPLALALCMHDPDSRTRLWNPASQEDRDEIDALPTVATDHMLTVAMRVCGMGKEAVSEGKGDSETSPNTSSSTSSPPVLAVA